MKRNYLFCFLIIAVFVLTLIGCRDDEKTETFTVNFYDEEILLKKETVEKGKSATPPVLGKKEGYEFVAWDKDFSNVQRDLDVKVIYNRKFYTITYDSNGGDINESIDYFFGESVTYYPIPKKVGYEFLGWFLDLETDTPFEFGSDTKIDRNLSLIAKWDIAKNDVYYHTNCSIVIEKETLDYNDEITLPDLEREHYVFDGWYTDYNFTDKITEGVMKNRDIHLYAKWTPKKYKVNLDVNGGDQLENAFIEVQFTDKIVFADLPVPTHPEGEFICWKFNDEIIDSNFSYYLDEDITIIAEWLHVDSKFADFETFITKMDNWIKDSKSYSLYSYEKILSNSLLLSRMQELYTLLDKEDYYLEVKDDTDYEIIQVDGDKVLLLDIKNKDDIYYVDTNYLYDVDSLQKYEDLSFKKLFNKHMYYEKINDNHYKITAKYNLDNSVSFLDFLGLDDFEPTAFEFTVKYEFKYDSTSEKYSISFNSDDFIAFNSDQHKGKLEFKYEYHKTNTLDKFDLAAEDVIFLIPKSIDTVKEVTDISSKIETTQTPNPHFYKLELESGQYTIETDQLNFYDISLYDIDGNVLDLGPLWNEYNKTFKLNEGTYYLRINNPDVEGYSLEFIKLNYSTIYDFDNPLLFEEGNQIEIEGETDFVVYEYESDVVGVLDIFTNVTLNIYYINGEGKLQSSQLNFSKYPDRLSFYAPISVGKNYILFTASEAVSTEYELEFIEFTQSSSELSEMIVLTDEYASDYYVFGKSMPLYLRIDVVNPGTFTIEYESEKGSINPSINFYSVNSGKSYSGDSTYLLEGTYYIRITTYQEVNRVKVRYSYTEGYDLGFSYVTNDVSNYQVINIFLEKDEEFDIPIYEIFKDCNIEISDFLVNPKNDSIITVNGSKIKGFKNGIESISITLYEAFTRKVYFAKLAVVHVEDSENAIEIKTFKDLLDINNNLSGNYVLKADIDLKGIDWIPIGLQGKKQFTGTFINPEGYTISNLECSSTYCGLFDSVVMGYISGIKLKDVNINTTKNENGLSFAGGIAKSISRSTIYNSSVTGTINSHTSAGGIVDTNNSGQIINCSFEGNITVSGSSYATAGGIVGYNYTDKLEPGIVGNVVKANIVSDYHAGGISGRYNRYGGFTDNIFEGNLSGIVTNEQYND